MDKNMVIANGRIKKTSKREDGNSIITLVTKDGKISFPELIVNTQQLREVRKTGAQHVDIKAHIESISNISGEGTEELKNYIVTDTIKPESTMLEKVYGIRGSYYSDPKIKICLSGTVLSLEKKDRFIYYTIKNRSEHGEADILMTWNNEDPPETPIGSRVCAVCKVFTTQKHINGKFRFYQNIVVLDLAPKQEKGEETGRNE